MANPGRYRDVLDPSDPYWPRVRRLHIYLWANGTLAAGNGMVVMAAFLWLFQSIFFRMLSLAWRGGVLFGMLFLIDWITPGIVSCVFQETVGYETALFTLSQCTIIDVPSLPLISLGVLLLMILVLIWPVRKFMAEIFEVVFMSVSIILLGYPLKFIAFLALQGPELMGKIFDSSYVFGPLSTGMGVLGTKYQRDYDRLWDLYIRSQGPAYEKDLDNCLEELEARYFS